MILQEWLEKEGISAYAFCNITKINHHQIYCSLRGATRLSRNLARLVEEETGGEVTMKEAIWPEDYATDPDAKSAAN